MVLETDFSPASRRLPLTVHVEGQRGVSHVYLIVFIKLLGLCISELIFPISDDSWQEWWTAHSEIFSQT